MRMLAASEHRYGRRKPGTELLPSVDVLRHYNTPEDFAHAFYEDMLHAIDADFPTHRSKVSSGVKAYGR